MRIAARRRQRPVDGSRRGRPRTIFLVVSRVFRTFGLAERRPALAQAVMAPLICWSFSSSMFKYLLVDISDERIWFGGFPSFCEATIREGACLKRVIHVISRVRHALPVCPRNRTCRCIAPSTPYQLRVTTSFGPSPGELQGREVGAAYNRAKARQAADRCAISQPDGRTIYARFHRTAAARTA